MAQTLIAILIVAASAGWLSYRLYRTLLAALGKANVESGCGHCPNNPAAPRAEPVQISRRPTPMPPPPPSDTATNRKSERRG